MLYKNFASPTVSVDTVVFQLIADNLHVLLIKRRSEPFMDSWALPGSYNNLDETTFEAMSRSLKVKAGVTTRKLRLLEQLYTFDSPERDPRGHAISVTYMGLTRNLTPVAGGTTEYPLFFPVDNLPDNVAYDHHKIIEYAMARLRSKLTYTNAIFALLPKLFTLTQLQTAYEIILNQTLDKRNFRKKFLSLDLMQQTDELIREGAHRPARLYKFNQQSLEHLSRTFD